MSTTIFNTVLIYWNLSQPQHTRAGVSLMHLYYDTDLRHLLDDKSGYPHNGCEHTLHVRSTISDLKDWLDVVAEDMGKIGEPFVAAVNQKIKEYMEKYYETHNG